MDSKDSSLYQNTRPRKSLGQHFLTDTEIVKTIVLTAELTSSDTVIEIGPGKGVLTQELAKQHCRVIAIELDNRLIDLLKKKFVDYPDVSIVHGDILQTDIVSLLKGISGTVPTYKVVANLPYYITTPILRLFLETYPKPDSMVIMVQKEVGETITAQPGQMSPLSVGIQFYGEPVIVAEVPAKSFFPPPKVDSVVLKVKPYLHPPVNVTDEKKFFRIVRAGFSTPRKQLRNSLSYGLGITPAEAVAILEKAGISPQRRAETLTLKDWFSIYTTT